MILRFVWLAVLCGVLAGCFGVPKTKLIAVAFEPELRTAIRVDLLTVESDLLPMIPEDASGWFQNREALMLNYADRLSVKHLELVPAYTEEDVNWTSIKGSNPQYLIFVRWRHKAARYSFGNQVPEYLCVTAEELKEVFRPKEGPISC